MTPVRLEPAALRSRVKHSTTEPLRSRFNSLEDQQYFSHVMTLPLNLRNFYQTWHRIPAISFQHLSRKAAPMDRGQVLTFKKIFQEHYHSVKPFGSRSGPDMGPNCLQTTKVDACMGRVKCGHPLKRTIPTLWKREPELSPLSALTFRLSEWCFSLSSCRKVFRKLLFLSESVFGCVKKWVLRISIGGVVDCPEPCRQKIVC